MPIRGDQERVTRAVAKREIELPVQRHQKIEL
jgi:hypothetical protein